MELRQPETGSRSLVPWPTGEAGQVGQAWEAEDCERKKQWFAAVWHMDQLLSRNPDDPALRARRGAAQARLDDETKLRQRQAPASELPEDAFAR